jgi:hypothetical protein
MMLTELGQLLASRPATASLGDFQTAVLDENVLGSASESGRQRSFRYLRELYALDPNVPLFRGLQRRLDEGAQPLLALSSALQRDPSLRGTAAAILEAAPDSSVSADMLADAVKEAYPGSYSVAVAHKIGRNAASRSQDTLPAAPTRSGSSQHQRRTRSRTRSTAPISRGSGASRSSMRSRFVPRTLLRTCSVRQSVESCFLYRTLRGYGQARGESGSR